LEKWLASKKFDKHKKIESVKAIYDSLHIDSQTEQRMKHFFDKGLASLDLLSINNQSELLKKFTTNLMSREV